MGSLGRPSAATPELSVWLALSPELAGDEDGVDIEGARQSVVPNRREAIRVLGAFGFVSTKFGNAGIFESEGTGMGVLEALCGERRFWLTL